MAFNFKHVTLAIWVTALIALNLIYVQFHAGDDEDHFATSYAVSRLHFGPEAPVKAGGPSGSYVDAAIPAVIRHNWGAVRFEKRFEPTSTPWTDRLVFHPPGSPTLALAHAPQALAITIGRAAGLTVEQTIFAARIVNGVAAVSVVVLALALLPEGMAFLLLLLVALPKWLVLFASNSPDPLLLGITACFAGFALKALSSDGRPRLWQYALCALGILTLGGERPPLVAMGLIVLYVAWRRRDVLGAAVAGSSIAAILAWWAWALPRNHDVRCPAHGGIADQLVNLSTHGPGLVLRTLQERWLYYGRTFIGEIGYGKGLKGEAILLPGAIYPIAVAALLLGASTVAMSRPSLNLIDRAALMTVAVASSLGMFFAMAVSCTGAANDVIAGVQGRYFLPGFLFAAAALSGLVGAFRFPRWMGGAAPVFMAGCFGLLVAIGLRIYWARMA